ncbi:MAG: molybdopterin-dependent oxidoreductase [Proteobacteria bacterium]|nr:molybdopterin-dependent oxidoreductase [Pseudomonadota bacterium]
MTVLRSACPLDCPDACTLDVTVDGGRVTKVRGSTLNPLTAGRICGKVMHMDRHLYGSDRVLTPLIRTGPKGSGSFREASWDEALGAIAEAMRTARDTHGGTSILPCSYGGSNGYLTEGTYNRRLFSRLGASRLRRDVCAMTAGAALGGLYGKMPGVALTDYSAARLIVVWGTNPHATGIHVIPHIQVAQKAGAKLIVVDPRTTQLAKRADLHLAPHPATDGVLALAVARLLFEGGHADRTFLEEHCHGAAEFERRARARALEDAAAITGIDADAIRSFADLYAAGDPAVIRCGWGLERNRNGASSVAAVLALPAVANKFGVRAGGYTASNSGAWSFDPESVAGAVAQETRTAFLTQLGAALTELTDPPVHVLYVYNGNPLMTCPDQERVRRGLLREDLFVAVHDAVMTDTARHADVVLPATTFLEHDELARGYGAYVLNRATAVVEPAGQSRSNAEVFDGLLDRLGLARDGDIRDPGAMAAAIVAAHPGGDRLATELDTVGIARPDSGEGPIQMADVHPRTESGRIELVPEPLDSDLPRGLYGYVPAPDSRHPLVMITPADRRAITSTFFQLVGGIAQIRLHPDDAAARGITNGAAVRIHNDLGEVLCDARVTDGIRPGVVWMPKGLWAKHTRSGATSNALIPAALSDCGESTAYNEARVEVTLA